jgi:sugar lactone lactonase YvrE
MLQNGGDPIKKISDVTISNGMAWSLDRQTFYYIDTLSFEVAAYDYDDATGNINNKRAVIKIAAGDGSPDGMTIDNQGMLWIAHWDGWQVTRWDPNTGAKLLRIELPAARITSCTFGGENLQDLYITSAKV